MGFLYKIWTRLIRSSSQKIARNHLFRNWVSKNRKTLCTFLFHFIFMIFLACKREGLLYETSTKPPSLFSLCSEKEVNQLTSFEGESNLESSKQPLNILKDGIYEEIWETMVRDRIFPKWFDAMIKIPSFGSLLSLDIQDILQLISYAIQKSSKVHDISSKGWEGQVRVNYMHRKINRMGGLQYITHATIPNSVEGRDYNFTFRIKKYFGGKACQVSMRIPVGKRAPIYILLPYNKQRERLRLFLHRFIHFRKNRGLELYLIIPVLKRSSESEHVRLIVQEMKRVAAGYVKFIRRCDISSNFDREFVYSIALREASEFVREEDAVVFIADLDIYLHEDFFERCEHNTIMEHQAYFPVMYRLYSNANTNGTVKMNKGLWDMKEHKLICIRKRDFRNMFDFRKSEGSFTMHSNDQDLIHQIKNKGNLTLFRALDPGVVHQWNEEECVPGTRSFNQCRRTLFKSIINPEKMGEVLDADFHGISLEYMQNRIHEIISSYVF